MSVSGTGLGLWVRMMVQKGPLLSTRNLIVSLRDLEHVGYVGFEVRGPLSALMPPSPPTSNTFTGYHRCLLYPSFRTYFAISSSRVFYRGVTRPALRFLSFFKDDGSMAFKGCQLWEQKR